MSAVGSLFVREVNVAIVAMIVLMAGAAGLHYVSVVHELRRLRQEVCAAKLDAIRSRNPYLAIAVEPADTCAMLTTLTGQPPARRAASRPRTGA